MKQSHRGLIWDATRTLIADGLAVLVVTAGTMPAWSWGTGRRRHPQRGWLRVRLTGALAAMPA